MDGRIKAMSFIHKKLYGGKDLSRVSIDGMIGEVARELQVSYGFNGRCKILLGLQPVSLDADKALTLALIVNEVISNAFKYAFTGVAEPQLEVSLVTVGRNEAELRIADNGTGFDEAQRTTGSAGFSLISIFSKQLDAQYSIVSKDGTCFTLRLPV
jgi:two-component sensor histidine kinase